MTALLETTGSLLEDPRFLRDAIWPLVAGPGERRPDSPAEVTVRRRRSDGRLVAELAFGPSARVFAKLYPDVVVGAEAYETHRQLSAHGLGAGPIYRVPEPLAYLPDHGVLLLRAAAGERLSSVAAPELADGVRSAARWLAALHASDVELDASERAAQGVLRLARRTASAAAARPELEEVVRGLLEILAERYERVAARAELAPTHGRFSAEHVFLAPEAVTVVDLDRAALADPAKDVGEFLHRLRWAAGKRGRMTDTIDEAGEAFVCEYLRSSRYVLSTLEYHWSYSVVWTLLVLASSGRRGKGWDERSGFLLAELTSIPDRVEALLEP
jgi:Phosphotransferase enzyme family